MAASQSEAPWYGRLGKTFGDFWRRGYRRGLLISASAGVAGILALLAPLAGFFVALRTKRIQDAAASHEFLSANVPFGIGDITVVCLLFAIFGLGYVIHKYADAKLSRQSQKALRDSFEANFESFKDLGLNDISQRVINAVESSFPHLFSGLAGETAEAGNLISSEILKFVSSEDTKSPGVKYSASIFLYWSKEELEKAKDSPKNAGRRERLLKKDAVFHDAIAHESKHFEGVLELRKELIGAAPDAEPYVLEVRSVMRLPGAPEVSSSASRGSTERFSLFRGLRDIEDWCVRKGISADDRKLIIEHFTALTKNPIGSFMAIPLWDVKLPNKPIVGVLVVERSDEGLLHTAKPKIVVALAVPLIAFLTEVVSQHKASNPL